MNLTFFAAQNAGISDPVAIAVISTLGGVFIAYITNVLAKRVQEKKAEKQPKDRMEQMFDGYERLIQQKDLEDERKAKLIAYLEGELQEARETMRRLERDLDTAKEELQTSEAEKIKLKEAFEELRKEYKRAKATA